MRFKQNLKIIPGLSPIIVTPLINVIFLLFIFFTLMNSFMLQTGINVQLPKAVTSDIISEENYIITVTSENILYHNKTILTIKELESELKKPINKGRFVLIKADRRSSVGRIVDVWDLCRNLGIEKINIATNQDM